MGSYFNSEIKKIISKFQNFDNTELEYHFSFKNLEKFMFEKIFNDLNKNHSFYSIEQQVNILYEDPKEQYGTYRVTKQFKDGVNLNDDIIILKKSSNKSLNFKSDVENILGLSLHLNQEQPKKEIPLTAKIVMITIKLRISFNINQLPDWRYDLDLIKEIQMENNNLKEYKNKILFPITINNYLNKVPYNHIDKVSLEIEYIGDRNKLSVDNINDPLDYLYNIITPNYRDKVDYQEYIYKIATYTVKNKYLLSQFKTKSGFKRLSNNVIELNKPMYYNKVVPLMSKFYLTDKIDGQRCMLYITKKDNDIEVKLVADNLYSVQSKTLSNNLKDTDELIILDAEFIYNNSINKDNMLNLDKLDIYVFDVILFNNKNLSATPFENRFTYFEDVNKFLNKYNLGKVKTFIKLTDNYKKEIKDFYDHSKKQKYEIDGLIFTPSSGVIDIDKKHINKTYIDMLGYKWKPEDRITIDFYIAKSLNKNKKDYILCSGINNKDYDKLQIQLIDGYYKIIPKKYHKNQYFPIPFTPSSSPQIYHYIHNNDNDLTGKIGEFLYNKNKKQWDLIKIRTDRDIEVERGEYFGNAFKYAELNWHNIQNPLSINDLISDKTGDYFSSKSDEKYKPQRSFNSFVKTKVLESIVDDKLIDKNSKTWIIDLAAGKGQDLARIIDLGFKNGLFVDIDSSALFELIDKKHNLRLRTNNKMNIFVKEIDLSTPFSQIIKKFGDIPIKQADVVVCNFAIHYLANNDKNIKNIISLVSKMLNDNGRFIFTCFNGERVFNLLQNTKQWDIRENNILKYSIKKEYKSDTLTNHGQKIGVLLGFSNNEYYSEYLVNLDYFFNICEKNGLLLETSNSFETLLNRFKDENKNGYNKLNDNDKEFVSLYQYSILKKTKKKSPNNLTNILKINEKEIQGKSESNVVLPISFIDKAKQSDSVLFIIPIRETEKKDQENKLLSINDSIKNNIKKYNIDYKICVVEQTYSSMFNKKKLYNIGFEIMSELKNKFNTVVFIDLQNTDIYNIEKNMKCYIKLCNNPILLHKNYVFQKDKFNLINGFSNDEDKIIDRLNYYKIPLITSNINLIISKNVNYDDKFKDNGLNSIDYEIMESIIKDNIYHYIVDC